ncbi:MAG TPA: SDR family oxidoreductase [Thermoanaerobaculia bacterium]|nr:SDR family oxidoreductase [Thermoanaerobaculia bacterium]
MSLASLTVVITGASSGIGRATALEAAQRGANVVVAARRAEPLEAVAAECRSLGVRALAVVTDVARRNECLRLLETAERELGPVSVLINNAGFAIFDPLADADPRDLEAMMDVNYFGTVHCTQAALPGMLERKSGTIVNVASIAGIMGYAGMGGYGASKFAIIGFSEALRSEVMGRGIRVALVCPGTTETSFFATAERGKMPAASRLIPGLAPERVARSICDAAEDGRYRRIVPFAAAIYMRLKELAPRLAHALMRYASALLEKR